MTGRLIDQLFKVHCLPEEKYKLPNRTHASIWGNILPILQTADLRIANLETSITNHPKKWPDKAFNYRMHPENIPCLTTPGLHYCSLANNHILDYSAAGMYDTIASLNSAGIKCSGAGSDLASARTPALLQFRGVSMACFSFSDHYSYWAATDTKEGINWIDPGNWNDQDRDKNVHEIKELIRPFREKVDLIGVSLHWGPNYRWDIPRSFVHFAHALIDDCGVDLIHGHSSHHIQGIEIYNKKPIFYGCGDFLDDYAVDEEFRNDLGFLYMIDYDQNQKKWKKLKLFPTKIEHFQVNLAEGNDKKWLQTKIKSLCESFGTVLNDDLEILINH